MKKVFLCHATDDKPLIRRIAKELKRFGILAWLDEEQIRVGDSLRAKLDEGLRTSDYIAIALSNKALSRHWVRQEIGAAFQKEASASAKVILPILLERTRIPLLLQDRVYADFSTSFDDGMRQLLKVFLDEFGEQSLPNVGSLIVAY